MFFPYKCHSKSGDSYVLVELCSVSLLHLLFIPLSMRIAFLVSTFPKLSETFILNQVTGLLDAGHEITIFAHRPSNSTESHEIVEDYNLLDRTVYTDAPTSYSQALLTAMNTVLSHPSESDQILESFTRGKAGGERLANLQTLLDYSDFSEFDIVHAHFGTTAKAFDFLTQSDQFTVGSQIPFIVSFYGYDISHVISQDKHAYDDLFPLCNAVTALSDDMKSKLTGAGCPSQKCVKQQLAIDTQTFQYHIRELSAGEPINVLTIARFTEKKGLKHAVDAIGKLSDQYNINYRIAGDGPLRGRIEQRIEHWGIKDRTELLGWVDQKTVQDAMHNAHIFLLPSRTASNGDQEGTPTVLLEAQATGLPVISTYHAGIPEIVADGESGILVREADTNALVESLEELFERANEWPEMGKQGRKLVEETHSIPTMVRRLETLYQNKISELNSSTAHDKNQIVNR
jgi:colanic acid/amylovoran biosynthesis glycosyltransferase